MTYAKPNWPPRAPSRKLPPAPKQDVAGLIDRYASTIAAWPAADRWRMRQLAVNTLLEVLRDCDDKRVRMDAYNALVKIGVAQ
jgi:hypothetical protein